MILGKLVNLRAPEMGDLERNYRWVNDRDVMRLIAVRYEWSLAAEEQWMRERTAKPLSFDNVFFAIETKENVHIGNISLFSSSPEDQSARLAMMIGDRAYWSRGYGTDALMTRLCFAFEEMNLHRIELETIGFNARARATYRKCGFVEEGTRRQARYREGTYHDMILMSVLRDEFHAVHDRKGQH